MNYPDDLPFETDDQAARRAWADRRAARVDEAFRSACTLNDPPYWLSRPSMFLEGGYVDKWGRERDFQRARLYEAHSRCFPVMREGYAHQYGCLDEAREALDDVLSDPWFVARFGRVEIDLRRGRGKRSGYTPRTNILRLADHHLCRSVILHELAHALVPPPHAGHGRLFARVLTELMVRWPLLPRPILSDDPDEIRDANRDWLERVWAKYGVAWMPRVPQSERYSATLSSASQ